MRATRPAVRDDDSVRQHAGGLEIAASRKLAFLDGRRSITRLPRIAAWHCARRSPARDPNGRNRRTPRTQPGNRGDERDEIETMLRRLEELRRATSNSETRTAYQAAVEGLDAVVYRLTMLRSPGPTKPARSRVQTSVTTSPPPTPKCTPARAVAARMWRGCSLFDILHRMRHEGARSRPVRKIVLRDG